MTLLAPLFLIGLAGIGLPLWLHHLETRITEREPFSTTMFMEPAKRRIHVKRKLKYLLLLALRILFLVIMVIAFAKPMLTLPPQTLAAAASRHHLIVLDASFSMNAGDRFAEAIDLAAAIIADMENDDAASIYAAAATLTAIAPPTRDRRQLAQALAGLQATKGRLDFGAMIASVNSLITELQSPAILHLVSDFQASGQAARFADMVPDALGGHPLQLEIHQVAAAQPNWAVDSVSIESRNAAQVGLRAYNAAGQDAAHTLILFINGLPQGEQPVSLNDAGIAFALFENLSFAAGDNRVEAILSPGDALPLDDRRFAVFDNSPPAPVLILTDDLESLGLLYISAALETAPRGYEAQVAALADLDPRILPRYPWVMVEDLSAVDGVLAEALADYVNGGGAILAATGENALGLAALPVLDKAVNSAAGRRQTGRMPITMVDGSHPALADASGWSSVNARPIPVSVDGGDRVLIAQADDLPILLERGMGQGRFMLLTIPLDNSLSDLPVKPTFVSFMAEMAKYLANEDLLAREHLADSFLQLALVGGASGQIFDPDGINLSSLADTTRAQDLQLRKLGFYSAFTPAGEVLIAVNPDRRESDLSPMDAGLLQSWQDAVAATAVSDSGMAAEPRGAALVQEEARKVEVWRIFLILLASVVLLESLLGNQHLRVKTGTL